VQRLREACLSLCLEDITLSALLRWIRLITRWSMSLLLTSQYRQPLQRPWLTLAIDIASRMTLVALHDLFGSELRADGALGEKARQLLRRAAPRRKPRLYAGSYEKCPMLIGVCPWIMPF